MYLYRVPTPPFLSRVLLTLVWSGDQSGVPGPQEGREVSTGMIDCRTLVFGSRRTQSMEYTTGSQGRTTSISGR